ncbi:folate-binding protein YgfZ [Luteimonas marina]|uniref:Folate-binding protein YgfZ n=1 Tax=Luteimonas marina TaxID=488485 RepID=A0A5C5UAY0_9GAMM|nr:folate-binding protein YgfZ [Luteimonas marina]TWT23118.1 folate-binding protein YgfZ [Luteimonas marina]
MSDKPTATNGEYFTIPGWAVVALRGEDASRFAQAQFMGDVAALAPGQWQWNGWLTPKGRVIALFALLRLDETSLLLLLADADPGDFAAALSRFVFRSKVKVTHEAAAHVAGAFRAPDAARGAAVAGTGADSGLALDFSAAGSARTLRIGPESAAQDPGSAARWRACDLAHGLPRLDPAQREQWTPQQLSLDRLRAYSVKKGCYPGQEIVARTHFLGQAKRGLVRLQGAAVGELDEVMAGAPPGGGVASVRPIGQIVCAAGDEALAVMPLDAGDGPFSSGGQPCRRLPLLDGLAR